MRSLGLFALALLAGCRQESRHTVETIAELFSDGTRIAAVAKIEDLVASRFPLEHGSGRRDEVTRWSGVVRWRLPEEPAAGLVSPYSVTPLGREHAVAEDASGARLPEILVRAFSADGTLLFEAGQRGDLRLGRASAPRSPASAQLEIDNCTGFGCEIVPTRSGRHFMAKRRSQLCVVAAADLAPVRTLGESPGLVDFQRRFRGVEDHARVLTDDLRYWIKVPFNAGEPQGHNHCVAVIYDLERDAAREVALALGEEPTGIEDAENLDGELLFLANHGGTLHVVDSQSRVQVSLPAEHFGAASRAVLLFWEPRRRRIAAWQEGDGPPLTLCPIQVFVHDYGTGETRLHELDWADTVPLLRGA